MTYLPADIRQAISVAAWPAVRRPALALACVAVIASGCAALLPTPTPGPTRLEPAGDTQVEVADNRAAEPLAVTISQEGELRGILTVGSCETTNVNVALDGPFTVGLGEAADAADTPMPPLVDSSQLQQAGGEYRLLVRIDADADVSYGPLGGVAPLRGPGQC